MQDASRTRNGGTGWVDRARATLCRLLLIGTGYSVAVAVATLVTVAHLTLPTVLPDHGRFGSFYGMITDWPMLLIGGLVMTATSGFPGFVAVILVAALAGWRDAPRFTVAGAANALLAVWLQGGLGGNESFLLFSCIGGGLAGGFSYWLVAESRQSSQRAWAERIFSAKAENTPAKR